MTTEELFNDFVRRTQERSSIRIVGLGTAKDVQSDRCNVERFEMPELQDVRLNAVIGSLDSYVTLIPKENSYVLYGILENMEQEAVVLKCSEVDKVIIKTGQSLQEISTDGTKINGGGENLKTVLNDLIAEIEKIIVVTGTSPNVPAIEQIKTRLNKILI